VSDRYTMAPDGSSITCKVCGTTSHNTNDVEMKFCGHCGAFHNDRTLERDAYIERACEAVADAQAAGRLIFWTIYEKPHHWVVRGQETAPGGLFVHLFAFAGSSLDEARAALPPGLVRMARNPKDDPTIVEVWF
jgi:ribosomal protein L37E